MNSSDKTSVKYALGKMARFRWLSEPKNDERVEARRYLEATVTDLMAAHKRPTELNAEGVGNCSAWTQGVYSEEVHHLREIVLVLSSGGPSDELHLVIEDFDDAPSEFAGMNYVYKPWLNRATIDINRGQPLWEALAEFYEYLLEKPDAR